MSGFVAAFNRDSAPAAEPLLAALVGKLEFRGPDGRAHQTFGPVGLGHALLKIGPDALNPPQPLSLDGQTWIVGDVRLDARDELIARLDDGGLARRAPSDAELVLRAYRRWGADCVAQLMGDFAFVIWDGACQKLFAARDHFGVKPLFYALDGRRLVLSNTLDCVMAHPDVPRGLEQRFIAQFLAYGFQSDPSLTVYRAVQRLPQAHCLEVTNGEVKLRKYWTPWREPTLRGLKDAEVIEQFKHLITQAVRDRVRGDKAGILLSGGLDSSTLAAAATGRLGRLDAPIALDGWCATYPTAFDDPEPACARQVAGSLGVPLTLLEERDLEPSRDYRQNYRPPPEPDANPYRAFWIDLLRSASSSSREVLYGQGGDEVLARDYFVNAWREEGIGSLITGSRRLHGVWYRPPLGLRARLRNQHAGYRTYSLPPIPAWLNPELARLARETAAVSPLLPGADEPVGLGPRPPARFMLFKYYWGRVAEIGDAGITGVPANLLWPFLDLRLMRFLLRLPPYPWFSQKCLLRAALALEGLLSPAILTRPKTALQGDPLKSYLRTRMPKFAGPAGWNRSTLKPYLNVEDWGTACATAVDHPSAYPVVAPLSLARWILCSADGSR